MKRLAHLFIALILATGAIAVRAAGDVGILDRLAGEVTVKSGGGNSFRATPFMKVRDGDVLTLAAGSEAQIVYFDARRRELWKGAAAFKAGTDGSTAVSGKPAAVSEAKGVPSRQSLDQAGNVQRLGSLTLRSSRPFPDDGTIARAHADYLKWTAAADPDDILPELSMIGLVRERRDPELLAPYLAALHKKQPNRPEVKALLEQYQAPAGKP